MRATEVRIRSVANAGRNLTVCFVTETFPPEVNGVAMTLGRLTQGLRARQHCVQIVRPRQGKWDCPVVEANCITELVSGLPLPGYKGVKIGLPATADLKKLWQRQRPDIIYIATEGPLGWSAVNAAKALAIPMVSGFHTNFHVYSDHYRLRWLKRPIFSYLRHFHNQTHRTLVPTYDLKQHLEQSGYERVDILSRGVDCQLFSPSHRNEALRQHWGLGRGQMAVLYVGRLAAEKNLPLAVRCFRAMQAVQPRLKFVLVGDGPLFRKIHRENPDFIFCGLQLGAALAEHYACGDIFLFPSFTETFGNVVMEAMASGLAVVMFDYAAGKMHIRHNDNGVLVPYRDQERFIEQAVDLVRKPQHMLKLRKGARRTAETTDWNIIVAEFEQLLHDCLKD